MRIISPSGSAPVAEAGRIDSLDVLRGVAVLGILVLNVQAFAMPWAAYFNPTAYGDLEGANLFVWVAGRMLADQKFMTIFSMLFGASIVLMTERAEACGDARRLHYRRMGWLLVIGLLHAHLLWSGDILFLYAVCGMLVYPLRRQPPGRLRISTANCLFPHRHRTRQRPHRYSRNYVNRRVVLPIRRVEGDDLGVCMRRAQHRGVGGAGPLPHVVGEAPAPGEQCRVLHAFHRAPDETGKGARGVRGAWHAIGGSGDDWGDGRRKRVGRQPRERRILTRSCPDPRGILVR